MTSGKQERDPQQQTLQKNIDKRRELPQDSNKAKLITMSLLFLLSLFHYAFPLELPTVPRLQNCPIFIIQTVYPIELSGVSTSCHLLLNFEKCCHAIFWMTKSWWEEIHLKKNLHSETREQLT